MTGKTATIAIMAAISLCSPLEACEKCNCRKSFGHHIEVPRPPMPRHSPYQARQFYYYGRPYQFDDVLQRSATALPSRPYSNSVFRQVFNEFERGGRPEILPEVPPLPQDISTLKRFAK